MIDGADVVAAHRLQDLIRLRAVDVLVGTLAGGRLRRDRAQIGGDDAVGAQPLSQRGHQLRADLPQRPCHENATHVRRTCLNRSAERGSDRTRRVVETTTLRKGSLRWEQALS